jgi:hypothetical protein
MKLMTLMRKHIAFRWSVVAAIAAITLGGAALARADGPNVEVLMQVKVPDKNNPKTKDDPPQIEATVIGAQNLPPDKFSLHDETAKLPIEVMRL